MSQIAFQSSCIHLLLPAMYKKHLFFTASPSQHIINVLIFSNLIGYKCHFTVLLICLFYFKKVGESSFFYKPSTLLFLWISVTVFWLFFKFSQWSLFLKDLCTLKNFLFYMLKLFFSQIITCLLTLYCFSYAVLILMLSTIAIFYFMSLRFVSNRKVSLRL